MAKEFKAEINRSEEAVREVEVAEWKVREDGKVFCFECSEEMVRAGKAVG